LHNARRALDHGEVERADRELARVRPSLRRHAEYLRLVGVTRRLQKRSEQALCALYGAAALRPGDAVVLTSLGTGLRAAGRVEAALDVLRKASEIAPGDATTWYALGRTLDRAERPDEARYAYERALRCGARHPKLRIAYGDVLRALGHIGPAVQQYRLALRKPGSVRAWGRLANIKTQCLDAQDAARLERLYESTALGAGDRVIAGFAFAKALEDQQRHAEAFAVLRSVNAIQRERTRWNPSAFRDRNERIARAFATPPETASPADLGSEVIFIVSLPRAGSTLAEQILASHREVEGANELPDLWAVLDEESRRRGIEFPDWVAGTDPVDWHRLGRRYLERTARWRRVRPRFTDKALSNWRIIGAARAMLPGARFVSCRRDPLETCLSCYRQRFAHGQAFSYDLAELAACWHEHERMMRHWREGHPRHIHDLVHERLLAEPEVEIRRLLRFCGLRFDPACLRHHQTQRPVRTISSAQVREPLRAGTARAHLYGELLAPLREALALAAPGW
jgi:Tfp pilus assembly protein PilF